MNKLFKYFTVFLLGSAFSSFLFELRMSNPLMRRELLFYVGNNESYFLTFGLLYLSFIIITFIADTLVYKIYKRKKETNE
jgi:hypothetical protein